MGIFFDFEAHCAFVGVSDLRSGLSFGGGCDHVFLAAMHDTVAHCPAMLQDGETNLKIKFAFSRTAGVQTADQLMEFEQK